MKAAGGTAPTTVAPPSQGTARLDAPVASQVMDSRAAAYFFNHDPAVHFHVGELLVLDGEIDFDDLGHRLAHRLALFPRWRRRPVAGPLRIGPPRWEDDPDLALGSRLHRLSIPPPASDADLAAFSAKVWSWHLDPSRVPWEIILVEGLAGRRCAILVKAHRCLVDPLAELVTTDLLLDREDAPDARSLTRVRRRRQRKPTTLARIGRELDDRLGEPVRDALQTLGSVWTDGLDLPRLLTRVGQVAWTAEAVSTLLSSPAPETPFNRPVGPQRRLAWTRFSVPVLRAIQDCLGGPFEQVVLTILADGLGRLLREMERTTDGLELVVIAPRGPRRAAPDENSWSAPRREHGLIALPVGVLSPQARHASVGASLRDPRPGSDLALIEEIGSWLLSLPTAVQRAMSALAFQATNTMCLRAPDFPSTARVLGHSVVQVTTFAPLAWNVGLAFSACQRGDDELVLGINADPSCVPDLAVLTRALGDAYRELAATAGVPPLDPARSSSW